MPVVTALFGLGLALTFWPGQAGAAEPSRWCYLAITVPALLWFARIKPTLPNWLAGALFAWASASLLWTTVIWDGLDKMFQLSLTLGCFVIGAMIAEPVFLYIGLGTGMAVSSGFAILQAGGLQPAIMQNPLSLPAGLFVNPSLLGEACAPIIIVLLASRLWLLAGLVTPALLLSHNRSGLGAVIVCGFVMIWQKHKIMASMVAAIVIPAAIWFQSFHFPHFWDSLEQRLDMWQGVLAGWSVFGHGIGSLYSTLPYYADKLNSEPSPVWLLTAHAHSDPLEYFFELGIPGVALLGALCWCCWRSAGYVEKYGLAAVGLTALVGFPLHEPFTAAVAGLLAGHAARGWDLVRSNEFRSRSVLHQGRQRAESAVFAKGRGFIPAGHVLPAGAGAISDTG